MIIQCFDLTFHELEKADIESVRLWRNSDFVRRNMQDQNLITAEAQAMWFQSVSEGHHWYFIVKIDKQAIGVANLKDICSRHRSAEAGLFMIHEQFADGIHPMTCSAVLIHLAFDYLNLDVLHSTSLTSSTQAVRFNQALGFQRASENNRVIRWRMDARTGRQSRDRILSLLRTYQKNHRPLEILLSGEPRWPVKPSA